QSRVGEGISQTVDSGGTYCRTFETHASPIRLASFLPSLYSSLLPRGEIDRERAQARKGQVNQRDDGLTPEQRRERYTLPLDRDAKAFQEKAAAGGGTTDSKIKGSAKK
ncbi:hypothetical protein B296_00005985, partial [Ensete ventricosum]